MAGSGRGLIVVSNTSPLTNLAAIGQFALLQRLFEAINVSQATVGELEVGGNDWPGAAEVRTSPWVLTHRVQDQTLVDALRLDLDRGEAETIALGIQLKADLVLLDERPGRLAAEYLGLRPMGVIGLLIRAKQLKLLTDIHPSMDALRHDAGFYIHQTLYDHALRLAGESIRS